MSTTTVEFDLSPAQVEELVKPARRGPIGNLILRMAAKAFEAICVRLAGPTSIEVSEAGIRVSKAGVTQEFGWSVMRHVSERPLVWAFTLAPTGMHIIPKSAVAADEEPALSAQLSEWAGSKYKLRKE